MSINEHETPVDRASRLLNEALMKSGFMDLVESPEFRAAFEELQPEMDEVADALEEAHRLEHELEGTTCPEDGPVESDGTYAVGSSEGIIAMFKHEHHAKLFIMALDRLNQVMGGRDGN